MEFINSMFNVNIGLYAKIIFAVLVLAPIYYVPYKLFKIYKRIQKKIAENFLEIHDSIDRSKGE